MFNFRLFSRRIQDNVRRKFDESIRPVIDRSVREALERHRTPPQGGAGTILQILKSLISFIISMNFFVGINTLPELW